MKTRLIKYIHEHELIESGDVVCVGLSGGADSVCLFLLLLDLKKELGFSLKAFHVDHKLRGRESEKDKRFVAELCAKHSCPLRMFEHDIAQLSIQMKKGLEETGRILRRSDAYTCLKEGCTKIALAHHKNDQAETFLFNAARGCSLDGISGIKPKAGSFIHPLLSFSKEEIIEELKKREQNWCIDQTNENIQYTRNHIRQVLIPELVKVNAQAVDHIFQLTEDLTEVQSVLNEIIENVYKDSVSCVANEMLLDEKVLSQPEYVVRSVIKKALENYSGHRRDISRVHINDTESLFEKETGKEIILPYDMKAVRVPEGILLKSKSAFIKSVPCEIPFEAGKEIKENGFTIRSELIPDAEEYIRKKNKYTKCFDYDKISRNCLFRTRKAGDRLVINTEGGTKKLKDYLIECKIPKDERDRLLVFADSNQVYWVVGLRMSENVKVTKETKTILKITISGGYTNEFSDQ